MAGIYLPLIILEDRNSVYRNPLSPDAEELCPSAPGSFNSSFPRPCTRFCPPPIICLSSIILLSLYPSFPCLADFRRAYNARGMILSDGPIIPSSCSPTKRSTVKKESIRQKGMVVVLCRFTLDSKKKCVSFLLLLARLSSGRLSWPEAWIPFFSFFLSFFT